MSSSVVLETDPPRHRIAEHPAGRHVQVFAQASFFDDPGHAACAHWHKQSDCGGVYEILSFFAKGN